MTCESTKCIAWVSAICAFTSIGIVEAKSIPYYCEVIKSESDAIIFTASHLGQSELKLCESKGQCSDLVAYNGAYVAKGFFEDDTGTSWVVEKKDTSAKVLCKWRPLPKKTFLQHLSGSTSAFVTGTFAILGGLTVAMASRKRDDVVSRKQAISKWLNAYEATLAAYSADDSLDISVPHLPVLDHIGYGKLRKLSLKLHKILEKNDHPKDFNSRKQLSSLLLEELNKFRRKGRL